MYPVLFRLGFFTIYSYGFMLAVAFIVCSWLAVDLATRQELSDTLIYNLALVVFFFGILGARILYILIHQKFYFKHPLEIVMLQHGGLSWFGGLIAGSLAGVVYLRMKRVAVLEILDLLAPFIALGQAIGRVGCLLNGCCYGRPSDFGLYLPCLGTTVIPTQIYSSLILLVIFIFLRYFQEKPRRQGIVFFTYLLLYSLKRFLIEFWRADAIVVFLGLSVFQLFSLALFFVSGAALIWLNRKTKI